MKKYKIYAMILAMLLTCLTGCGKQTNSIPETTGQLVTAPAISDIPAMTDGAEAVLPTEKESSEATTTDTTVTEPTGMATAPTETATEATEPAPEPTEPPQTTRPSAPTEPPKETKPTEPEPTEPKPTEPRPTEPKPTEPKPTGPKPAEPKPTEPKPTEPKPTEPRPTEPKPTEPEPTEPKPTEPKPTEPTPTEPAPTEPEPDAFTEADHRRIISKVKAYAQSYSAKGFTFQWKDSMTFGWDVGYMGTPRVEYEGVDGVIEILKYHIDLIYQTSTDPAYGLTTTVMTYKVERITADGDLAYVVIYGG